MLNTRLMILKFHALFVVSSKCLVIPILKLELKVGSVKIHYVLQEAKLIEEKGILDYLFVAYKQNKRVLLPCHPRDLIGLALDMAAFKNNKGHLTIENIKLPWKTYFIELENEGGVNE